MDNSFFTLDQGTLLIKLLIALFISDFILQTSKMVDGKRWFSRYMFFHILIVFAVTLVLSQKIWISLFIAVAHYLTDGIKYELKSKKEISVKWLFIADQFVHILVIVLIWGYFMNVFHQLYNAVVFPLETYCISIIILGYVISIEPAASLIKNILSSLNIRKEKSENINENIEEEKIKKDNQKGGKLIGIYERIIILTFVLLGQYEAIGFLITGKSIIRFADRNSDLKSEYVLVGTMMSYAYAIITGVIINWLLIFQ